MKKIRKYTKVELINRSRPRPEVRQRSVVFEDKTKYRRSREKERMRREVW